MLNKTKKFQLLIQKISSTLNEIISEINTNSKAQTLFNYSIDIKINQQMKTINFFVNDKLYPSNEIRIEQPNYINEILKQMNEIINKMHFFNYHIRMLISNEETKDILLELPSESLKIPDFSEIPKRFGSFYGEKKLTKDNILIKNFKLEKDYYKINLDLCYIYHNFAKYGTFDLLLFNNRLYDINLSKNENIINELKSKMFFKLSEDNIFINFNKLKDSSINLCIFGNYSYNKKDSQNNEIENNLNNNEVIEFIIDCMNSMNDQFYERIKIFSENKQMNFYFDVIGNCLKDIYTTTNDHELFEVYSKLFESKDDPQYINKKLAKNFMLCSSKK